jgi:putative iron-only hydrogenase system regulator
MEGNRIGVAAIIVEDPGSVREVNEVLHEHSGIIIGRRGIPYRERNVSVYLWYLMPHPMRSAH